ncbi:MAG: sigma factor [Nocardioidaceae bacterium]
MTTIAAGLDHESRFHEHRPELVGYCYRMLGSAFDAEDATQETMVRAWRAIDSFRGPVRFALVALPHRDQRLPRHAQQRATDARDPWICRRRRGNRSRHRCPPGSPRTPGSSRCWTSGRSRHPAILQK